MATATILAAGCLPILCSLWTPWYWTKSWGSSGFSSCPQLCTCRFDCGWAKDTFHEVHALTLERTNRPSRGAVQDLQGQITSDHVLAELGRGGAVDVGERGMDLVTEQYQKAKGMLMVLSNGRVVNRFSEKQLERQRQTAENVVVKDELREDGKPPSVSRRSSAQSQGTSVHSPRPPVSRRTTSLGGILASTSEEPPEAGPSTPPNVHKISTETDPSSIREPRVTHD